MPWKPERPLGLCPKSHKNHQNFYSFYLVRLNKHDRQIKELDLCCHLLLPKQRAASLSCTWRPRPGHWCSQGRKFWAVAETCCHYPLRMLLGVADQLTQECIQAPRWWTRCSCTTSKPCLHSNLQTLRPVGTSAVADCCVSLAAHKRRPRNRPYLQRLCWSAVVTNSAKVCCPKTEPVCVRLSVGWI